VVEKIFHDETSIRRLIRQFPSPAGLAVCYEAGPPVTSCTDCLPP